MEALDQLNYLYCNNPLPVVLFIVIMLGIWVGMIVWDIRLMRKNKF